MGDVKAKPVGNTVSHPLQPAKAETNLDTLGDVKAEAVVEMMADSTRSEVQDTSRHIKPFKGRYTDGHVGRHSSRAQSPNTLPRIEECEG